MAEVNMDDLLENSDGGEPSRKKLLDMLYASDIDDETKESLKSLLAGDVPQFFGGHGSGTFLAVSLGAILFLIIFFFGYKLFKSIKEKEKKKEEKKKLKQMKKKK